MKSIMKSILEVKNLKMHFPVRDTGIFKREKKFIYALDGVSFNIDEGETFGIAGESGCGKSTLALTISRLHTPTSGEVYLCGENITAMKKKELLRARRNMQIVFQDPYGSLNPRMSCERIIAEPLEIYRRRGLLDINKDEIRKRVEKLMDMVGLLKTYKNRLPHQFSSGQRQRIGIARALALDPKLILADEPVSALDVSIQAQILNLLLDIQKEMDLSYMFITHDLAALEYVSSRIAIMYLGMIVELCKTEELFRNPLHPYTQALLSAAPIPDPKEERQRKRIVLPGDVPPPNIQRPGCNFYDRCLHKMEKCLSSKPELKPAASPAADAEHLVACYLDLPRSA